MDQKMLFVGILNKHLPPNRPAVLVGGTLVEFLSGGGYRSWDIDLVGNRDALRSLLVEAGFEEDVRGFVHKGWNLVLDVSTKPLRPTEQVVEFEVEGLRIPAVSIEDAIVDRLLAAKFWRSETDWEQALTLYEANKERIRAKVLSSRAQANEVLDFVEKLKSWKPSKRRA